jgi:hypothetical protein
MFSIDEKVGVEIAFIMQGLISCIHCVDFRVQVRPLYSPDEDPRLFGKGKIIQK